MADVPKKMPSSKVQSMVIIAIVAMIGSMIQFYLLYQAGEK